MKQPSYQVDDWRGLYAGSWLGTLQPESFAHPAKYARGLIARIYDHLIEEGWVKPGDVVVDIFGGVACGAIDAMTHGLRWTGIEIEPKFIDMGVGCECTGISKAEWRRFYGRWDRANGGEECHWCPRCLEQAKRTPLRGKLLLSNERARRRARIRKLAKRHGRRPALVHDLPLPGSGRERPPYVEQVDLFAQPSATYERNSGRIPHTEPHRYQGNIESWAAQGWTGARLICGDSRCLAELLADPVGAGVASPPYANSLNHARHGIDWTQIKPDYPGRTMSPERCARASYHHNDRLYGDAPGQLGGLPEGQAPAAGVASPPFTPTDVRDRYATQPGEVSNAITRAYTADRQGRDPGNLALLPMGEPRACVSSPPYAQGCVHQGGPDQQRQQGGPIHHVEYGQTTGQLGAMPDGEPPAAGVASPPYNLPMSQDHSGRRGGQRGGQPSEAGAFYRYGDAPGQLEGLPMGEPPAAGVASPPYASIRQDGGGEYAKRGKGGFGPYTDEPVNCCHTQHDQRNIGNLREPAGDFEAAVSSPPFADTVGTDDPDKRGGLYDDPRRRADRNLTATYGDAPGQLAAMPGEGGATKGCTTFWTEARKAVEQLYLVLPPGGHAVWVTKAYVRDHQIVDFPEQWRALCENVGFVTLHKHRAWMRDDLGVQYTLDGGKKRRAKAHLGFFRRLHAQKYPHLAIYHEVVWCMVKPETED